MKMRIRQIVFYSMLLLSSGLRADEGMWMLGNLTKQTQKSMKSLGLHLSADKLYHPKKPSLKDGVVSFGGFCSGVVVSEDGLIFTNHHCGFSAIQQHSTLEQDLIRDGFVARTREEELPNPELYVRFLLRTEDVTKRMLKGVGPQMSEADRAHHVDSVMGLICEEVLSKDSTLIPVVDAFYGGNEFWLSVYRDFNDVRLVFAPPSSVGKFGWDTDNWVWPRHTGDFSVFRIYANTNNQPADYSPENVPYLPEYVVPVSLDGYQEGSFAMTIGYPGMTDRYITSFGVEERMNGINQAMIDIRGVKQQIWKREMDRDEEIRIKYASKYDESSNYWKNSIGMNRAIRKLGVIRKKQEMENTLRQWINHTPAEREHLLHLFTDLELNYKNRRETNRAMSYFGESFLNGPELVQLALTVLNFDFGDEEERVVVRMKELMDKYANYDLDIDKEVFVAMLREYPRYVDACYLPEPYKVIEEEYGGDERAYVDWLYRTSEIPTPRGLQLFFEQDSTYNLFDDPAISLGIDLIITYFDMNQEIQTASAEIERGERLFNAAVRRMYAGRNFYPDANFTMRLSIGTVGGYTPYDGAWYEHYTTTQGIFEKVRTHEGDPDFAVQPEILQLLKAGDFGRYANKEGELNVCFITNNDITGGNSGSAIFNANGELLGLAFDGNWEAMSGDLIFEPALQRCIGVDVRYMLYMIEKYGQAGNLIDELKINASR